MNRKKRLKKAILAAASSRIPLCSFILVGGESRPPAALRHAGCVLRLPVRSPWTVACSKVHRTFSLAATPSQVLLTPLPQLKKAALMAALLVDNNPNFNKNAPLFEVRGSKTNQFNSASRRSKYICRNHSGCLSSSDSNLESVRLPTLLSRIANILISGLFERRLSWISWLR